MKPLLLLAALLATAAAQAQQLRLETDSLPAVQARARQQGKLVLVVVAPPPSSAQVPAATRALRSRTGLTEPAAVQALGTNVLVKEVTYGSTQATALSRQYAITTYPTYLYFAPDGTLLHRRFGNSSSAAPYVQDVAAARQELGNPRRLGYYQAEVARGNHDAALLRDYLTKSQQLGELPDPALLDLYAEQLPARAFDRAADVLFILELGPLAGSRAFQLTHLNQLLIDSLYRVLPLARRTELNNRIIRRTSAQAVATRNVALAQKGAAFARSTWGASFGRGARAYDRNLLDFYQLTRDTASYLPLAYRFYQQHFMSVSADSARSALAHRPALPAPPPYQLPPGVAQPPGTRVVRTVTRTAGADAPEFVSELNAGAWSVYLTGTRNRDYLSRAVQWSQRTVDALPNAAYYDTLAHLLYRQRFYAEAEAMQQQAVARAATDGLDTNSLTQELRKMKSRQLP